MAPKGGIPWRCSRATILEEGKICHMTTNTVTQLPDPQGFSPDLLTDLLRSGA